MRLSSMGATRALAGLAVACVALASCHEPNGRRPADGDAAPDSLGDSDGTVAIEPDGGADADTDAPDVDGPDADVPDPGDAADGGDEDLDASAGGDATDPADADALADAADPGDATTSDPDDDPLVTEVMAKNVATLTDAAGATPDWIELWNPHAHAIDLGGFHLSDDPARPAKWTFPSRTLAPGAFIVVLAVGEGAVGGVHAGELRVPFKLDADGDVVVLTAPDGRLVQRVDLPRQLADVSYGLAFETTVTPLVRPGALGRFLALGAAAPPEGWAAAGFDDSGWFEGTSGFGWAPSAAIAPGPEPSPGYLDGLGAPLADSVADWSTTGTQGERHWTYGYWLRPAGGTYAPSAFTAFPASYWTGNAWDWPNGNPPWTYVGATGVHGNGTNNGPEHWPIRRYTSPIAGTLVLAWSLAKTNAGGNGVSGHIFVDGVEVDHAAVAGDDLTGVMRVLTAAVGVGSTVDLAHDPTGPGGATDDGWDGSAMTLRAWLAPSDDALLGTRLVAGAAGSGLLVRHAFAVDEPQALGRVVLGLEVDDGAEAFVDGVPVAALDAPEGGVGPAPVDRSAQSYEVTVPAASLGAGPHVLAVRGYDSLAADGTLVVRAWLEGRASALATRSSYFTTPTPGRENGPPASDLGPIVGDLDHDLVVTDADPITVGVTIVPTVAPIAAARLYYRAMFEPEVALDLAPAPDAATPYRWTAAIPADAAGPGQLVRWRVEVADTAQRTTRAPRFDDPLESEQYVGTVIADPTVTSDLPVLHWFIADPGAADTPAGTRASVFYRGELYDNVRFDIHGQSTQSFPKRSYDLDFPSTHRFAMVDGVKRMADVNLLSNYADKTKVRNTLAYAALAAAGVAHHLAFPVRIQRNGAFYAVADLVEDGDARWLERLGKDPAGALYKMYDGFYDAWQGEKKTRKDEGRDDLQAAIDALGWPDDARATWLWDHVDMPAMVSFFAGLVLVSDGDCCHKNYYAYRDTNGTGAWSFFPWDVDLTFGHNWTWAWYYFDEALYADNGIWVGGGNRMSAALYADPTFAAMFVRRVRTLMDDLLQTEAVPVSVRWLEGHIAELTQRIGADAVLDGAAWGLWGSTPQTMQEAAQALVDEWLPARRAFVFDTLAAAQHALPAAQSADYTLTFWSWEKPPNEPDGDYVALRNPSADEAIDLSGTRLQGDVAFTLPPGTVIAPGADLYIAADINGLRRRGASPKAGERRFVVGPWTGALAASPHVELVDRTGRVRATLP